MQVEVIPLDQIHLLFSFTHWRRFPFFTTLILLARLELYGRISGVEAVYPLGSMTTTIVHSHR